MPPQSPAPASPTPSRPNGVRSTTAGPAGHALRNAKPCRDGTNRSMPPRYWLADRPHGYATRMPIGPQPRGARGTVGHPYSALNLRLVLAIFGLVSCTVLAVLAARVGY